MGELPKDTFGGRVFYRDERLNEWRDVENPHERFALDKPVEMEVAWSDDFYAMAPGFVFHADNEGVVETNPAIALAWLLANEDIAPSEALEIIQVGYGPLQDQVFFELMIAKGWRVVLYQDAWHLIPPETT